MTGKNRKNGPNEQSRGQHLDDADISRILDAFQEELPADDDVDLDALFSDVLGKGLLSEKDIDEGFEGFLNRRVRHARSRRGVRGTVALSGAFMRRRRAVAFVIPTIKEPLLSIPLKGTGSSQGRNQETGQG